MEQRSDQDQTATLEPVDDPRADLGWSLVVAHHPEPGAIGARIALGSGGRVELGRGGDAFGGDVLADEHLSRNHATFEVDERGTLQLRDCGSRNGTYLNGARIELGRVAAGDVIGIGRLLIVTERSPADYRAPVGHALIGDSWAWTRCLDTVDRGAGRVGPILLWGATGTGKDRLVQRIHERSRAAGPLVTLHCGGFAESALALVSAVPLPAPGTLHLDGIEDASDALQAALLELLEHGRIRDPAHGEPIDVSVRIVASSRADPQTLTNVRRDFLHRLLRWIVAVPSLASRRADVALLMRTFVARYAGSDVRIHPELAFRLLRHTWPGNVRELEAVVERAVVERSDDDVVTEFPELGDILVAAHEPAAISTMSRVARPRNSVVIAASGTWFVSAEGEKHNLERRKILAALLGALVTARREQPGTRLTVTDLLAAAWPDDRFVGTAGANRVYVALATLRKMGLRDVLARTEGGYVIDPEASVKIIDG